MVKTSIFSSIKKSLNFFDPFMPIGLNLSPFSHNLRVRVLFLILFASIISELLELLNCSLFALDFQEKIKFDINESILISKLIDGNFPDYE